MFELCSNTKKIPVTQMVLKIESALRKVNHSNLVEGARLRIISLFPRSRVPMHNFTSNELKALKQLRNDKDINLIEAVQLLLWTVMIMTVRFKYC